MCSSLKIRLNTFRLKRKHGTHWEWEYGTCGSSKIFRRHRLNGKVQSIIFRKGEQSYVDGIGHLTDKWHESHWSWKLLFEAFDEETHKKAISILPTFGGDGELVDAFNYLQNIKNRNDEFR